MSKYVFTSLSLSLLAASGPVHASWWKFWAKPNTCNENLLSSRTDQSRPVDLDVVQRIRSLGIARQVGHTFNRLASMQSYEILTVTMSRDYRAFNDEQIAADFRRLEEQFLPLHLKPSEAATGTAMHILVRLSSISDRDFLLENLAKESELQIVRVSSEEATM